MHFIYLKERNLPSTGSLPNVNNRQSWAKDKETRTQSRSATPRGWHRPKSLSHHLLSKACSGRSLARTQASQHRMGPPSTERRHHQYPHVAAEESSSGFLFSGSCVEKWGDFSLLIWTHLHRKTKLLD